MEEQVMFSVTFDFRFQEQKIRDIYSFVEERNSATAVEVDRRKCQLKLSFKNHLPKQSTLDLFPKKGKRNKRKSTSIDLELFKTNFIGFNLYDNNGKLLYNQKIKVVEGNQEVKIKSGQLNQSGEYYYQLISDRNEIKNKMTYLIVNN